MVRNSHSKVFTEYLISNISSYNTTWNVYKQNHQQNISLSGETVSDMIKQKLCEVVMRRYKSRTTQESTSAGGKDWSILQKYTLLRVQSNISRHQPGIKSLTTDESSKWTFSSCLVPKCWKKNITKGTQCQGIRAAFKRPWHQSIRKENRWEELEKHKRASRHETWLS